MSNIVSLRKREPMVWVCNCGCSSFLCYEDNTVECAACGKKSPADGGWMKERLPIPSEPKEAEKESTVVSFNAHSPAAALHQMLRHSDTDDLVAVITIKEDGRVRTWGGIDTAERRSWLRRRLKDAYDLLTILASA